MLIYVTLTKNSTNPLSFLISFVSLFNGLSPPLQKFLHDFSEGRAVIRPSLVSLQDTGSGLSNGHRTSDPRVTSTFPLASQKNFFAIICEANTQILSLMFHFGINNNKIITGK